MLHDGKLQFVGMTWGYRTPKETHEKKKPWINARMRKRSQAVIFGTCLEKAGS